MATETYSLTHADVSAMLGISSGFTATGRPTQAQVTGWISRAAGIVNGSFEADGFTTAEVAASTNAVEFAKEMILLWVCQKVCVFSFSPAVRERYHEIRAEYRDYEKKLEDKPTYFSELYSATEDAGSVQFHEEDVTEDYGDDIDEIGWVLDEL